MTVQVNKQKSKATSDLEEPHNTIAGETTTLLNNSNDNDNDNVQQKKSEPSARTPLPWGPTLAVCLLFSIQPLTFELIFPFISTSLFIYLFWCYMILIY